MSACRSIEDVMPKLIVLAGLLLLADTSCALALSPQGGAGDQRATRPNTWTARSGTGLTLAGTWTVKVDPATGAATGTWTLIDAAGRTAANGAWSAAKSATGWNGAWRAAVAGRSGEYSGTWTARVDLKADAPLAQLFEEALRSAVGGTWRAAGRSGTWTIQAFN
jgi:hypothetical protein